MTRGVVFDVREFSVHDGPGIRTTVFLKGCPLRCAWCHNPEGLRREPQEIKSPIVRRISGREYGSEELAVLLNRQAHILRANEGGVTFSGGEPLLQAAFVAEVIDGLRDTHVLLDTSGCGDEADFRALVSRSRMVYFDLKLIDSAAHRRWTGGDNAIILNNLRILGLLDVPYVARVPLVPGVTDTNENLEAIAAVVKQVPGLVRVDLLPYNRSAGAKYRNLGLEWDPDYDETAPVNANTLPFREKGIEVRVA